MPVEDSYIAATVQAGTASRLVSNEQDFGRPGREWCRGLRRTTFVLRRDVTGVGRAITRSKARADSDRAKTHMSGLRY
jgi:hypothetical protein